jgi:hypothetical protein
MKDRWKIALATLGCLMLFAIARPVRAQNSEPPAKNVTLYVDRTTGQVFIAPGSNRVPMKLNAAVDAETIERQVEQKVEQRTRDQVRAAVAETKAQQQADNAALAKKVAEMTPPLTSYMGNFQNKFRIGALAYLDYGLYTHTGFGPQFLDNLNPPGPGNNLYNSFDINRVYLNTYFMPSDDLTFRFTPEMYRANGTPSSDKTGTTTGIASNLDGELDVRVKYAYLQYKGLLDGVALFRGDDITLGAQSNPLVGWEDDFGQYRFVYLSPWNYASLSSTQIGLQLGGPINLVGGERTYAEYAFGVYDNGSYKTPEQTNTKQAMGRVTVYPFGANWKYQGLGLTGFYDYGYGNVAPDSVNLNTPLKASDAHFTRIAAILHYAAEQWNILGELDYGNNAFTLSNLYTGSGPLDAFGTATGTAIITGTKFGNNCSDPTKVQPNSKLGTACYDVVNTYGPQTAVYQAFLNNGRSRQLGVDFMGHYHIPRTKLTGFGMFQWFIPNANVNQNPLDFQRFVVGVSYQYNEYLRIALDSRNLLFYHDQFGLPVSYVKGFNYVPGSKLNGQFLPKSLTAVIPNLVPRDIHALFVNVEFSY